VSLLDQIRQKTGVEFRPATETNIELLQSLGVPSDALDFYSESDPARTAEIGKVRLLPIAEISGENRDFVPGAYSHPCGYVVFATTRYGDAFCFDTRRASGVTAPIVLIAHDLEPEHDTMKREDLEKLAKPIAPSFDEFLTAFVSETLDITPLYPSDISGHSENS
jgi:SMI1 / KNR4 family (SUKH-1)